MTVKQADFHTALRDPNEHIPKGLVDDQGAPAGRRFNVYRNNVTTSLMDALEEGFPVIRKLLDDVNFRNLARDYQANTPPSSPLMMHFGAAFPAFLRGHKSLVKIPYLGDVAELELALRRSYHATDSSPVNAEILGQLSEHQLLSATFDIAPPVMLVCSKWPILGIWHYNSTENAPKPSPIGQCVMISRPEFDPRPEEITLGDVALIRDLQAEKPLSDALQAAHSQDDAYDFGRILGQLLAGNAITNINFKDHDE